MKVPVYDTEGKEHLVEAVDAKEMIASGSYTAAAKALDPATGVPLRTWPDAATAEVLPGHPQAPQPRDTLKLPIGRAGVPVPK